MQHREEPQSPYADPGTIFAGTANDYALYRIAHPSQVADYVAGLAARHTAAPRMVELGCGTGTLTLELAARGVELVSIDPSPEMISVGRAQAASRGLLSIDWRVGTGERVGAEPGTSGASGAVMADSFHWMDRQAVLTSLDRLIAPGGFVAIVCSRAQGTPRPWWHDVIAQVRARFVGSDPAAGVGTAYRAPVGDHESILRSSPFLRVNTLRYDYPVSYSIAELVAAQRTFAYSSRPVLGERHAEFEAALTSALTAVSAEPLTAWAQGAVIVGRRE
ncbi:class I SAM-dependent methyltransferase [Streptomyces chartreusis]|uniref:class I SAM-dependent methyltransferase n=1 Tax=Streptomyces chartreusis TaxID=1969 RepID=UPI00381C556E